MSPGYRSGHELRALQPLISMAEQAAEPARDSSIAALSAASTADNPSRREPEKTSRALVDESDGRCELQRMRRSLDTNDGTARGDDDDDDDDDDDNDNNDNNDGTCCPSASCSQWWAETRDRPRPLSSASSSCEARLAKSKLDEGSPQYDHEERPPRAELAKTTGSDNGACRHEVERQEDVDDWLEAAPKNREAEYRSSRDIDNDCTDSTLISVTASLHTERSRIQQLLDGYEIARVYLAHVLFLDWRDLPSHRSVRKADRIWVLGATDREGRHRTRLLVVGREWRPRCLKRVNMTSQPVVYAGGGRGFLTPDLFLWWFHHEFAPTAMALHPNGAILVAQQSDHVPRERNLLTANNGLVRLVIVPKHYVESKLVAKELRTRLALFLLSSAISEARINRANDHADSRETVAKEQSFDSIDRYIKRFTLKEAFAELHRAWLTIWPGTFSRCWNENEEDSLEPSRLSADAAAAAAAAATGGKYFGVETLDFFALTAELHRLSLEAGLPIDQEDLQSWLLDRESECARDIEEEVRIQTGAGEENDDIFVGEKEEDDEESMQTPKAKEVVKLLSRVLIWMESEPLDPAFLLAVRAMRATAMFMVSRKRENVTLIDRGIWKLAESSSQEGRNEKRAN